jgi:hypothetical protein
MDLRDVPLSELIPPNTTDSANPDKLARHGELDWRIYTPIIVEQDGRRLVVQDGLTRVENARRSGIRKLPAYVFPKG